MIKTDYGLFCLMACSKCLSRQRFTSAHSSRTGAPFQHIPWIGRFLTILPLGEEVMRFRRFSGERAAIRLRNGSTTHDLFHHFVSDLHFLTSG